MIRWVNTEDILKRTSSVFKVKLKLKLLIEGDIRVCGDVVLRYFWCGIAVIFILKYGVAVLQD